MLLDLCRERLEGPDILPLLARLGERHGLAYWAMEANGAQLAIVQEARRRGIAVRALRAETDKITRSLTAQVRVEAGQVYFPEHASWLGDFESELLSFPKATHDDQVDVLSYAALEVFRRGGAAEPDDARSARETAEAAAQADVIREAQVAYMQPQNDALWTGF